MKKIIICLFIYTMSQVASANGLRAAMRSAWQKTQSIVLTTTSSRPTKVKTQSSLRSITAALIISATTCGLTGCLTIPAPQPPTKYYGGKADYLLDKHGDDWFDKGVLKHGHKDDNAFWGYWDGYVYGIEQPYASRFYQKFQSGDLPPSWYRKMGVIYSHEGHKHLGMVIGNSMPNKLMIRHFSGSNLPDKIITTNMLLGVRYIHHDIYGIDDDKDIRIPTHSIDQLYRVPNDSNTAEINETVAYHGYIRTSFTSGDVLVRLTKREDRAGNLHDIDEKVWALTRLH